MKKNLIHWLVSSFAENRLIGDWVNPEIPEPQNPKQEAKEAGKFNDLEKNKAKQPETTDAPAEKSPSDKSQKLIADILKRSREYPEEIRKQLTEAANKYQEPLRQNQNNTIETKRQIETLIAQAEKMAQEIGGTVTEKPTDVQGRPPENPKRPPENRSETKSSVQPA